MRTTWTGLEEFWLGYSQEQRPLTFVGPDADEVVGDQTDAPAQADIDLGAGGSGNDVLSGTRGKDVLNGNGGRDRCVGERKQRCER